MNSQTEALRDHGQAMDRMYRFQRHIYDASRRYYLLGRNRLLDRLQPPHEGSILEIGCGTGRNLAGAATRYKHAKLFGIDISQEMLKSALTTMQRLHRSTPSRFACVDATSFNPQTSLGQAKFDRIYFSYTLSMIPDWQAALRHATSMLAPDGELHIVDFGQSEALPTSFRMLLFWWLKAFDVNPRADMKSVIEKIAQEFETSMHFEACYGGYAWIAAIKSKNKAENDKA
jgi:S-adenosylmethionine-diacylgycerolhomoserine-N-methlytransferase